MEQVQQAHARKQIWMIIGLVRFFVSATNKTINHQQDRTSRLPGHHNSAAPPRKPLQSRRLFCAITYRFIRHGHLSTFNNSTSSRPVPGCSPSVVYRIIGATNPLDIQFKFEFVEVQQQTPGVCFWTLSTNTNLNWLFRTKRELSYECRKSINMEHDSFHSSSGKTDRCQTCPPGRWVRSSACPRVGSSRDRLGLCHPGRIFGERVRKQMSYWHVDKP